MKEHFIPAGLSLAAIALGLALGCTKTVTPAEPAQPEVTFVLSATMEGAGQDDAGQKEGTKTYLLWDNDESVYHVRWKEGDHVSINGNTSTNAPASDLTERNFDFTFSGNLSAPYNVLYPATSSSNIIALSATQSYVANSFDPRAAAAYGTAVKNANGTYGARLHNFCGIIRLALKGSATLSKIEIKSRGSEKLYGDFTISNFSTGAFTGGTAGKLTYSFGNSGLALSNTDTYCYIALPAQTYSSGLEALVYQTDGAFMRLLFQIPTEGKKLKGTDLIEYASKEFGAGRDENLFAINALTAEDGGEPTAEAPGITVATYNVMRLDSDTRPAAATSGDNSGKIARPANAIVPTCTEMREALGQAIYNTAADLIGFNEIGDDMYNSGQTYSLQDIAEAKAVSYTWKLNFPGSESGNYHYCNGFAYKSSVLTLNESGKAWLRTGSESYSTSSASNSGDPNRFVVWAKFTHKASSKVFYFFVTQLPTYSQDGGSGTSNTNMSGGVNAFATAKAGSYPQIMVGDLNSAPGHSNQAGYNKLKTYWTDAYEAVSAAGNLAAFYSTYSGTQTGTGDTYLYSFTQFTKNHPERRIDHIMTHGACTAQSYRTVRNVYEFGSGEDAVTCCPSDHFPVVAYITLD